MQKSIFRSLALTLMVVLFGAQAFAQGRIELNPGSKGVQIYDSNFKGFSSTFSFNAIESELVKTEAGDFSKITIAKTVLGGDLGGPSLPIARELVAVPFGATPVVNVVSYTTTDYNLNEYGIERVFPQQPSYSKNTKVEDMVFHYDAKAYQVRSLSNAPKAGLTVLGTMRGIQLGALQIEPISYNPATNTLRVYNDIEVEVVFENANIALTEETLVKTYSPYFDVVYKQLFNTGAINDVYDDHPDLFASPVKMIVVADRMFEEALQPWLEWKIQKGFFLDVKYTDQIGNTSNDIKAYILEQYETNQPSFLVVVGDKTQVVPSINSAAETGCVSDLYYSSVDGDIFPDIYHSRMSCETVEELESLIEKILQYEQYTMPDPSYLKNALLIAGHDDYGWTSKVGRPSIQYATTYYYNEAHGYEGVHDYLGPDYTGCYTHLSEGVGFANYTAHGGHTSWSDPAFTVSNVNALTNADKYFWAMGNCCIAADWGYSTMCFAEAMIRADKKGAWGYIGSCPNTYWWEDYYFAVGATTVSDRMPTYEETTMGNYDALWIEDSYNVLSSVPFVGNLAVVYAHAANYSGSVTDQYYFEAYHTLGDGSVMPYRAEPIANEVSHLPTLPIGVDFYTVTAAPYSYVGISKDGELYGAGMIDETGTTNIELTPITSGGDVTIVVTHPAHIPYIETVPAAALDGAFIAIDDYSPRTAPVNETTSMAVTFKNVGTEATEGTTTVTVSSDSPYITFINTEASFSALAADEIVELSDAFSYTISEDAVDGEKVQINCVATCGSESWEGKMNITVATPVFEFVGYSWDGLYEPGETYTIVAQFKNKGHYRAIETVANISSSSNYITIEEESFDFGTLDPAGIATAMFDVTVSSACPTTEIIDLVFEITAANAETVKGDGIMQNTCDVVFELYDSYGDGWNGSKLRLTFDDGSEPQEIVFGDGQSFTTIIPIGIGVHVTVGFVSGSQWDYECSFLIKYITGEIIYQSQGTPTNGVACEFDVNCEAAGGGVELAPVENLLADTGQIGQVTLTWTAPSEYVNFIVLRNGVQVAETTETTYVDLGLTSGVYTYSVIVNYENGQSIPAIIIVEVYDSIGENESVMFAVYPNPAKDYINVVSNAQYIEYQLINSVGQVVLKGNMETNGQIMLGNVNSGIYFLKMVADGNTKVHKVLVD